MTLGDNPSGLQQQQVIDEHLFVEAIALTSMEVSYKEPTPSDPEKVLHFHILSNNH
jgi:hypothetical protein